MHLGDVSVCTEARAARSSCCVGFFRWCRADPRINSQETADVSALLLRCVYTSCSIRARAL